MSILKGILHHWNKTTKSYDTIHPETESAQITDWHQGIVNTLASTGLSSLVNVLSSDSLLALLIKKVFDAAGVKYLTGQNGYVCLGDFFGSVIIQWGMGKGKITLPISATVLIAVTCVRQDSGEFYDKDGYSQTGVSQSDNAITTWTWYVSDDGSPYSLNWIAICKQ